MPTPDAFDWEAEGRRLGQAFDALHAIVVLGQDHTRTAEVALGIARTQARRRRVAVGDMLGGAKPIEALVTGDDMHGLVDSFNYGVSLNRIAVRVPSYGELFVLPGGTHAPDYSEMLPSPRWRRLSTGFREVGALLIVAAPADAPGIEALVDATDGAVVVGNFAPRSLAVAKVLASVREQPAAASEAVAGKDPRGEAKRRARRRGRVAIAAGVLLSACLVGIGAWLAYRPLARPPRAGNGHLRDSAYWANGRGANAQILSSTLTADSAGPNAGRGALALPVAANPADSASAAAFSVVLLNANTEAGAILNVQESARNLPAATYAIVPVQQSLWYRVFAGAYVQPAPADSLLAALRTRRVLDARSGSVVRAPFAFLVDSGVARAVVAARVASYIGQGRPVYPLFQPDGTARLYVGAFETPAQAATYAESLRAAGITPVLVYRIGRVL